jgi:hypothetical protein
MMVRLNVLCVGIRQLGIMKTVSFSVPRYAQTVDKKNDNRT